MRLSHPNLDPTTVVESDDEDYTDVLKRRGWVEAPALPQLPDVAAATVAEVLAEVGDDPERAALALEEERAGKARKSLTSALEQIAATGGGTAAITAPSTADAAASTDPTNDTEEPKA